MTCQVAVFTFGTNWSSVLHTMHRLRMGHSLLSLTDQTITGVTLQMRRVVRSRSNNARSSQTPMPNPGSLLTRVTVLRSELEFDFTPLRSI